MRQSRQVAADQMLTQGVELNTEILHQWHRGLHSTNDHVLCLNIDVAFSRDNQTLFSRVASRRCCELYKCTVDPGTCEFRRGKWRISLVMYLYGEMQISPPGGILFLIG